MGGVAALAAIAAVAPLAASPAGALPAGTPSAGAVTLTPSTGTSGTTFGLGFTSSPQACPGDNTAGYLWHTFLTPLANDPATLTYSPSGVPSGTGSVNLRDPSGIQIRNQAPTLTDGFVLPPAAVSFSSVAFGTLTPGAYWIGIACALPDAGSVNQTVKYWATGITITASAGSGPNNFTYAVGARPSAPTITSVTPASGQLTVNFNTVTSSPAVTFYTATAVPAVGPTVSATGATSPIVLAGLTNGSSYSVTMTATNSVGTSDPSSPPVVATPNIQGQPPVQLLVATPGPQQCTVTFAAPAGGLAPTGYAISVTGPSTTQTFNLGTTPPFSQLVSSLTPGGSYTVTVTPQHAAPNFGTPSTTTCVPFSNQSIVQQITVARPQGFLVLTQRCGKFGPLAADAADAAFPGYPKDLTALAAAGTGVSPTLGPNGTGGPDPQFANYPNPNPATYPTYCQIDLGTATLQSTGSFAGYYAADGRLNQVTVFDARDTDNGWTLNGTVSAFTATAPATDSFSGNYLGWTPTVTATSTTAGYTHTVSAGPAVDPGQGVFSGSGLAGGSRLAAAPAGHGLGFADLDARLKLLIPASVPAGTYHANLTLSFA
jgi:large repetitive protein